MPDMSPDLQRWLAEYVAHFKCMWLNYGQTEDCEKSGRKDVCVRCLARKWLVENPKQEADPIRMQATELWKRLMAIRERAEASGRQLLNWDELERELGRPEETDNGDPA